MIFNVKVLVKLEVFCVVDKNVRWYFYLKKGKKFYDNFKELETFILYDLFIFLGF